MSRTQQSRSQATVSSPHQPLVKKQATLFLAFVTTLVLTMKLHASDSGYDTIRFFTKSGKPEQISTSAVSPDGRYLALSFKSQVRGARSGITIVDLTNMSVLGTYGRYSYFALAFSSDSTTVMGIGKYSGFRRLDIRSGQLTELRAPTFLTGRVGITLEGRNGKLLIKSINPEFNPTLDGTLKVGDEIVAYNEGPKATLYDDSREWKSLLGKSIDDAIEVITGSPHTWVQIRVKRRGSAEPVEATVQRCWPSGSRGELPGQSESLIAAAYERGEYVFRSADTGRECAFASLYNIDQNGRPAISPDGRKYARIARVRDTRKFRVEVHSLEKGVMETSVPMNVSNFRDMQFTADSARLLVGTRDTVEVLNLADSKWGKPVSLTPAADRDGGRNVTRRIPLGLGFSGGMFTTYRNVVYSKPAALHLFAVSESNVLAVGSETGDIKLVDLNTKEDLGVVGEKILGSPPELLRLTRADAHLLAYANGVLHILEFGQQPQPVKQ